MANKNNAASNRSPNVDSNRSKYAEKQSALRVESAKRKNSSSSSIDSPSISNNTNANTNDSKKKQKKNDLSLPIETVLQNFPAKKAALGALKHRVSKRIEVANNALLQTCICPETGIVVSLNVPSIPGTTFLYPSPLAILVNARIISTQPFSYLNSLDTQVLAGTLILAQKRTLF
jgi:hypothetical protein